MTHHVNLAEARDAGRHEAVLLPRSVVHVHLACALALRQGHHAPVAAREALLQLRLSLGIRRLIACEGVESLAVPAPALVVVVPLGGCGQCEL